MLKGGGHLFQGNGNTSYQISKFCFCPFQQWKWNTKPQNQKKKKKRKKEIKTLKYQQ